MARTSTRSRLYRGVADVHDFEEFRRDLLRLNDAALTEIEGVLRDGCKPIETTAIQKAKLGKTGKLKRSIKLALIKNKSKYRIAFRIATKGIRYGMAVETGTYKDKAQPYIRPAFDKHKYQVADSISGFVVKTVDKYLRN